MIEEKKSLKERIKEWRAKYFNPKRRFTYYMIGLWIGYTTAIFYQLIF